jgi:hypothetical protein
MGRLCSNSDERTKSKSKRTDGAECGSQNSKQQIVDDNNRRKQKNKANLARKKRKKNTIKLENEHLREKLASTEQERLGFSEQNNALVQENYFSERQLFSSAMVLLNILNKKRLFLSGHSCK